MIEDTGHSPGSIRLPSSSTRTGRTNPLPGSRTSLPISGMVIHPTYVLSDYTILGTEDTLQCKTDQVPALKELAFQLERKTVNKMNK